MSGVHIMMAGATPRPVPSFVDAGTGALENPIAGTFQVPYPATTVAGRLLLMHIVATLAGDCTITTPAGWTLVGTVDVGASAGESAVYWKVADGTEGGTNVDVTITAGSVCRGRIYQYGSGIGVEAHAARNESGSDTVHLAQNITTLHKNTRAIQLMWANNNTTIGNISGESGTDYTEETAEYSSVGGVMSAQGGSVAMPTAITGGSATLGAAATIRVSHGLAIIP